MSREADTFDDLDAYIATLSEDERQGIAEAEAVLDLAQILYHARKARGLTQRAAALRSGLKQQAISRWERSHPNIQLDTLREYLHALGFDLDFVVRDSQTGEVLTTLGLSAQTIPGQDLQPTVMHKWRPVQDLLALSIAQWSSGGTVVGTSPDFISGFPRYLDYFKVALGLPPQEGMNLTGQDWAAYEGLGHWTANAFRPGQTQQSGQRDTIASNLITEYGFGNVAATPRVFEQGTQASGSAASTDTPRLRQEALAS